LRAHVDQTDSWSGTALVCRVCRSIVANEQDAAAPLFFLIELDNGAFRIKVTF
jgi:hypothetical protein